MKRKTFDIIWPFIEEMIAKSAVGQKAHHLMHDLGISFVPFPMLSDPYNSVAKILLKELKLSEDECLRSMSEQVWNETSGINDKEEYYKALCDLMQEWVE